MVIKATILQFKSNEGQFSKKRFVIQPGDGDGTIEIQDDQDDFSLLLDVKEANELIDAIKLAISSWVS